jgi:hypothetical protein
MCGLQQRAPMSKYWATLSSRNGSKVSYFANVPWFVSRQNRVEATRAPSLIASPSLVAVEQALGCGFTYIQYTNFYTRIPIAYRQSAERKRSRKSVWSSTATYCISSPPTQGEGR